MKGSSFGYIFKNKEDFFEFLYGCCNEEERRQIKIMLGEAYLCGK